jgi:hypothetical protein
MKTIFVLIMLCGICYGYAQTPPYAASTKTWQFGEQLWSDAIHEPLCNKEDDERAISLDRRLTIVQAYSYPKQRGLQVRCIK